MLEPVTMFDLDFTPLTTAEIANAPKLPEADGLVPLIPVPEGAPAMAFRHPEFGAPVSEAAYHNAQGRLLGYMLRFDNRNGGNAFLPVTYCRTPDGEAWRAKGFPGPYPLYNAKDLAVRPDVPVLVVHGEKAVDHARVLFPQFAVTTSPFGFSLTHNAEWSALEGRVVLVSTDHCAEGENILNAFVNAIKKAGPRSLHVLPPKLLAVSTWAEGQRIRRPAVPTGWDMSDAVADGWTADKVAAEIGDINTLQQIEVPMKLQRPGVADFFITDTGLEAEMQVGPRLHREWISAEIQVEALVRDTDGLSWGKLVRFKTADGQEKTLVVPSTLLAGEGGLLREALLNAGLPVGSTRFARERLTEYLSRQESAKRRLHVDRIGWHEGAFLTADNAFGTHVSGERVEYTGVDKTKVGRTAGTLDGWKADIAVPASGSSSMVFAISCAFAAPLVYLTSSESGGFHFVGASSVGKTTALQVAGSVWGGGGIEGYLKTWRATANGLEGIAAAHCDVLLCLDEIGQVRGNEAGQCAYMLTGGSGKIRGQRFGGARPPLTWRVMVLSSGELTLEAKVGEEKGSRRVAAGQLVRFVDLKADAGKGMGMFESLGSHSSPETLARSLKKAAVQHYGHAGLAFAAHLAADVDTAAEAAMVEVEAFIAMLAIPATADGQVRRIARRFALVAAAGEMAIAAGVVPWAKGVAAAAAKTMFARWLSNRGGVQADEIRLALEQVRYYLHKNANRLVSPESDESQPKSAASTGFIKTMVDGTKSFCFPDEVWRKDVCEGLQPDHVARILQDQGYLVTEGNRTTKSVNFAGATVRVHAIKESLITEVAPLVASGIKVELQERLARIT